MNEDIDGFKEYLDSDDTLKTHLELIFNLDGSKSFPPSILSLSRSKVNPKKMINFAIYNALAQTKTNHVSPHLYTTY